MEHEEKSIIIPYRTWHDKYVPMEEENNRLKNELANKNVVFHLQAPYYHIGQAINFTIPQEIGYLDINNDFVANADYENVIESVLRDLVWSAKKGDKILNKKQAKYYLYDLKTKMSEFEQIKKEAIGEKDRLRKEKAALDETKRSVSDKINSLPRIVRWLFGIKTIDLKQQSPQ